VADHGPDTRRAMNIVTGYTGFSRVDYTVPVGVKVIASPFNMIIVAVAWGTIIFPEVSVTHIFFICSQNLIEVMAIAAKGKIFWVIMRIRGTTMIRSWDY
jgi:hypothetical protein